MSFCCDGQLTSSSQRHSLVGIPFPFTISHSTGYHKMYMHQSFSLFPFFQSVVLWVSTGVSRLDFLVFHLVNRGLSARSAGRIPAVMRVSRWPGYIARKGTWQLCASHGTVLYVFYQSQAFCWATKGPTPPLAWVKMTACNSQNPGASFWNSHGWASWSQSCVLVKAALAMV